MAKKQEPVTERDRIRALFVPCETKAHFQAWLRTYLNLDFPDCTVSDESNSNPLDAIWQAYDRMRRNDLSEWSRVMSYAGRGGYKTLGAAALEVMVVLHLDRNVAHMAAIENQAKKAVTYVKDFFRMPTLRDFVEGASTRVITVTRHTDNRNGDTINDRQFKELPESERRRYQSHSNYIKIVICTMPGANSDHTEFFCVDEIDVVPKQNVPAYHQAQNIPDPRDGMLPLTLLTSTRKSRIGLVQWELDEGQRTGLTALHWNLIDVTAGCERDRHHPELPKVTYYVNDDKVKHITDEEYQVMNPGQRNKWYAVEGFEGCRGCRIFAACKGRLATHQTSKSEMLKPISFALQKFRESPTPDFISTEYLCRKPDASGLVYPRLTSDVHNHTAAEMVEMITGSPADPETTGKAKLIATLKERGATFVTGMDFGFSHNFAVVTLALYGEWVFVVDCYSQAGLELDEQINNCEYLKTVYGNPTIWPDPAYPGSIKTFKRKGFKAKDWEKKPFSVKAGIEIVRALIMSGKGKTRLYFLKGDSGVELLLARMSKYKFKMNAQGESTEEPDETDDDECDALRYVCMNALGSQGAIRENGSTVIRGPEVINSEPGPNQSVPQKVWMQEAVRTALGVDSEEASSKPTQSGAQVRKGKFIWSGG